MRVIDPCGRTDGQTPACIAMVFQYAPGGELFTRMKKQMKMPEPNAMFYFGEISLALKYLHDKHIVYRLVIQSVSQSVTSTRSRISLF